MWLGCIYTVSLGLSIYIYISQSIKPLSLYANNLSNVYTIFCWVNTKAISLVRESKWGCELTQTLKDICKNWIFDKNGGGHSLKHRHYSSKVHKFSYQLTLVLQSLLPLPSKSKVTIFVRPHLLATWSGVMEFYNTWWWQYTPVPNIVS